MAQFVEEQGSTITIRQEYSRGFRLFLGALSLLPLLAPYDLLYKPHWHPERMDWTNLPLVLFFLFMGLAPLTISGLLIVAAVFGPNETFSFDREKRRVTYITSNRPWRPGQTVEQDLDLLPDIQTERRSDSDGPDGFVLTLQLSGPRRLDMARFTTEPEALSLKTRLLARP